MSRSGYSDDCGDDLGLGRWRGQVASVIRGRRGQAFLIELLEALDAMPEKRLIAGDLQREGNVCAIGALGVKRGIIMDDLDPKDYDTIADKFGIAHQLVQEIEFMNDDAYSHVTPEVRWQGLREWTLACIKPTLTP